MHNDDLVLVSLQVYAGTDIPINAPHRRLDVKSDSKLQKCAMSIDSRGASRELNCHDLLLWKMLWKRSKRTLVTAKIISEDEYGTPGAVTVTAKNKTSFLFTSQLAKFHKPTAAEMQVWKKAVETETTLKAFNGRTPSRVQVQYRNNDGNVYIFDVAGTPVVYHQSSTLLNMDDKHDWGEHVNQSPVFRKLAPKAVLVEKKAQSYSLQASNLIIGITQKIFILSNGDGPVLARKLEFEFDDETCSQAAKSQCFIDIDSAKKQGLVQSMRVAINTDFIHPRICATKGMLK